MVVGDRQPAILWKPSSRARSSKSTTTSGCRQGFPAARPGQGHPAQPADRYLSGIVRLSLQVYDLISWPRRRIAYNGGVAAFSSDVCNESTNFMCLKAAVAPSILCFSLSSGNSASSCQVADARRRLGTKGNEYIGGGARDDCTKDPPRSR